MEDSTNVESKGEGSNQVDINEVMKEVEALKSQNERLLSESKEYKRKWQTVNGEKESIEKQKLEKDGNFQKLLEQEKNERLNLEQKLKEREKSLLRTQARSLLAEQARDAHDIGDLLRLDEVSLIQYDEENLSVVKDSVEKFVKTIREKKPWMFGEKKIPSSVNQKPSDNVAKPLKDMTATEREQLMKNSLKNIL